MDASDGCLAVGLGICALGGLSWAWYRHTCKAIHALKDVEQYAPGERLVTRVEQCGGNIPYIAVKGHVCADGNVLGGVHNTAGEGVEGVIRKIVVTEHKTVWNAAFKTWHDVKKRISTQTEVEPFGLVGGEMRANDVRVRVNDPFSAYKLDLTTVFDKYDPVLTSVLERGMNYISGEQVKGVQTVEEMLHVKAERTVIGQLRSTSGGHLSIGPPSSSTLKYYITSKDVAELVDEEKSVRFVGKTFAVLFFLLGGTLCAIWAYKQYKKFREKLKFKKWKKEMEEYNDKVKTVSDVEDKETCSICLTFKREIVFLPCGHICACAKCSECLPKCPVCRGEIESRNAVFFS